MGESHLPLRLGCQIFYRWCKLAHHHAPGMGMKAKIVFVVAVFDAFFILFYFFPSSKSTPGRWLFFGMKAGELELRPRYGNRELILVRTSSWVVEGEIKGDKEKKLTCPLCAVYSCSGSIISPYVRIIHEDGVTELFFQLSGSCRSQEEHLLRFWQNIVDRRHNFLILQKTSQMYSLHKKSII